MRYASGQGSDTQWFDYRPAFFGDIVRVEWDKDTMFAALPKDTANYLVKHGYARPMTEQEVEEYTSPPATAEPPARKAKRGD